MLAKIRFLIGPRFLSVKAVQIDYRIRLPQVCFPIHFVLEDAVRNDSE